MVEGDSREFGSPQPFDPERLTAAAHYVIAATSAGQLGYVKLNSILWHADLENYRWHGTSVTGLQQYTRTAQGPMVRDIARAVGRLVKRGKVAERIVLASDFLRREMISVQPPEFGALTSQQTDILKRTIDIIAPLAALQLLRMIEDDRLWQQVASGQAMPVATASVVNRPLQASLAA